MGERKFIPAKTFRAMDTFDIITSIEVATTVLRERIEGFDPRDLPKLSYAVTRLSHVLTKVLESFE